MPVLSTEDLKGCERGAQEGTPCPDCHPSILRTYNPINRAYQNSRSLTVPLLRVSKELQHAPYMTYYDHALNNWSHKDPREDGAFPTSDNLRTQFTFSGTPDEDALYVTDLRIELQGAEAVELMRRATSEIMGSNKPDPERIAGYLQRAAVSIEQMRKILMTTRDLVSADVFYNEIRPWHMGANSDAYGRVWVWEGSEEVENSVEMLVNTHGPNAGQSPLVPTLDAYLGLDEDATKSAFLDRVRVYMTRDHNAFLQHLRSDGHPIRSFVQRACATLGTDSPVVAAYDSAVKAMKAFRDAHLIIVTMYVIIPSRKAAAAIGKIGHGAASPAEPSSHDAGPLAGENLISEGYQRGASEAAGGGTLLEQRALEEKQLSQLMKFLKGLRDQTAHGYLS